jgi:hypothetical protein
MNKFKNIQRYISGAFIGMIAEYLYRVKLSIPVLIVMILIILLAVIDILITKNNNKL